MTPVAAAILTFLSLSLSAVLSLYALHRLWILYLYFRHYKFAPPLEAPPAPAAWPRVTVQLPIYNELYVVERLVDAVCALDYPKERLEIQILDDSTDETGALARGMAEAKRAQGYDVRHLPRSERRGFKAGALEEGLRQAAGEFIAVFDADFMPPADFLRKTLPHFADPRLGLVQARWGHVNANYSLFTRLQALFLDGHFMLEHTARNRSGAFFNFNGTAGVWRRAAIQDAGGWSADTLTEDLDLSYRAQLKGWRFLFLPELVCPAELPVDMPAFRNQQHRWTKGAFQVARKVLPSLWRGASPLHVKLEATAHLTANVGYCLMVLYTLLALPALWARRSLALPFPVDAVEAGLLSLSACAIALFYFTALRETASDRGLSWRDIPALMAFGVGMALNNARAVMEASLGISTEFRRTAKFNITRRGEDWRGRKYRTTRGGRGFLEVALAAYLGGVLAWCVATGRWTAVPFAAVFAAGYLAVGGMTLAHTLRKE